MYGTKRNRLFLGVFFKLIGLRWKWTVRQNESGQSGRMKVDGIKKLTRNSLVWSSSIIPFICSTCSTCSLRDAPKTPPRPKIKIFILKVLFFYQAVLERKSRTLLKSQLFKLLGPRQLFWVREIKAQTNIIVGRYFHNSSWVLVCTRTYNIRPIQWSKV